MAVHRFILFIFFVGLIVFGIVYLIRYFLGGKALEKKMMMEKKVMDDEIKARKNVLKAYKKR